MLLNTNIGGAKEKESDEKNLSKINIKFNMDSPKIKTWALRELIMVIVLALAYTTIASIISTGVNIKRGEINSAKEEIETQMKINSGIMPTLIS